METIDTKASILLVEDDPFVRKSMAVFLENCGFHILQAENGRKGFELFTEKVPDLMILDLQMPGMNGFDLLAAIKNDNSAFPTIVVSGTGSRDDVIATMKLGAWDYLTKPIEDMVLLELSVNQALEKSQLIKENKRYQLHLEEEVSQRTAELQRREQELKMTLISIVDVVASMVEKRDPYTAGHEQRVTSLALAIARELELAEERYEGLGLAATIHDLGKVAIPSEILAKPGKLTSIEYQLIQTHAQIGYDILTEGTAEFPWPIKTIVHQHHERINGSGYPLGLSGHDLLIESRILSVADVVEAMASHRPYRPALGIEVALQEISKHQGTLYDADVVTACLSLFANKKFSFEYS
ncbi:MAG: response regulator [Proteobacteria bacterium]|jgi:response regulator RpfG family c-di-GMP phosphodiesterase|nr:response regulator [Desulfocapsa sp.]MBU3943980.1 response regulator [Pseudomonadota bacterium]MCG2742307.1 response regulator [Desulfobacteraceae bacterium]MBU3983147.1 response regulator [Pseudomonadota bacterium]MBU4028273.1 response regulator [Pseudomonadota bacterium]